MCNQLTNTCKANQAAKDLCTQAQTAATAATPPLTGTQADGSCLNWLIVNFMRLTFPPVFNKFFGFNTNFKAVTQIDNTGKPVTGA